MARQLLGQGEEVAKVIYLDTPLPRIAHFSKLDRIAMLWQGLQKGGWRFLREKIRVRMEWERQQYLRRRENQKIEDGGSAQFHSRRIGDAFMRAVRSYQMQAVPVDVALFRPKLDIHFRLSGGRLVDSERNYLFEDNGWTPFVKALSIDEVPGNHDSMVLEPNVRVLVSLIRRALKGTGL
jgi:thioesterase domain-containing protein